MLLPCSRLLLHVTATPKGHPGVWVTLVTIVMLYSLLNTFFSSNPCIKQGIADDDPEVMKFLPTLSIVHKIEEDL